MNVVMILGDSAVGKMTVGQELAKETGYFLLHNHVAIEPVVEAFGYFDKTAVNDVRVALLKNAVRLNKSGLILTMMFDFSKFEDNYKYLASLIDVIKESAGIDGDVNVYVVELDASLETRLKRNKSANRLLHKPSKRDIEDSTLRLLEDYHYGRYESHYYELCYFQNHLRLVNDHMGVGEQTKRIIAHFGFNGGVSLCSVQSS